MLCLMLNVPGYTEHVGTRLALQRAKTNALQPGRSQSMHLLRPVTINPHQFGSMRRPLLWLVAVILMVIAAVFQRTTGPTYPTRGSFAVGGQQFPYRLIRSAETTDPARLVLPDPGLSDFSASLHYRRFKTDDTLSTMPFAKEGDEWAAYLPIQPAAGKMEYYVTLSADGAAQRIPVGDDSVVLRYKDPVPLEVLLPHVLIMFFSMLFGLRAGLGALFAPTGMRRFVTWSLIGMTVGGMILGPIVQNFAFGAYWTGFPFGGDLTDNKTLIMWLCWLVAAIVVRQGSRASQSVKRLVVVASALVMIGVYLIPHSLRGSELDYSEPEAGHQVRVTE